MEPPQKSQKDLLVALSDTQFASCPTLAVHKLLDPAKGRERRYVLARSTPRPVLAEITIVGDDSTFSSFLLSNYIIQNGEYHVMTPIDPLFWLLTPDWGTSWQPLDQILHAIPSQVVVECLDRNQLPHLFTKLQDGDDIYYKFSKPKALRWLQRKQQALETLLKARYLFAKELESKDAQETGGFVSGFTLGGSNEPKESPATTEAAAATEIKRQHRQAYEDSIQIVCNYLSDQWRSSLFEFLETNDSVLGLMEPEPKPKKVKVVTDWNAVVTGVENPSVKETKAKERPISAGAKRLLKVNTKGIKKMSSFFSVKKKTSA